MRVKGERMSTIAHLAFAFVLFLTVVILVSVSHSYDISKDLDFVKVYNYKKSLPDKGKAVDTVKEYVTSTQGAWLNDATGTDKCKDMVNFWWPTAGFASGSTPIVANSCDFTINLKMGPMEEQLQIKGVTPIVTTGCGAKQGSYEIVFTLPPAMAGSVTAVGGSAPRVTIAANGTISVDTTTVLGYGFKSLNTDWKDCMQKRQHLAALMHNATDCHAGFSSPLCTCVRAFTTRILSWQSKLLAKPGDKMLIGDVVTESVKRCVELRRSHDVREANDHVYARSSALLVFSVALLLNGLLNVLLAYGLLESTLWYGAFFVGYFVAILLTGLLDNKGGGTAEFETVLVMTIPGFVVHGGYLTLLHSNFAIKTPSYLLPFLHPVTFDIGLCALSLFTLVERGVVQLEYLLAETLKCHVVAAVYIAIIWYHCYGKGRDALESEFVQQSYLLMFIVGLLLSSSSAVTPYAVKQAFELHWLLPLAFTYIAFVNPGWSLHFRMAAKLNNPASSMVYNFNAVAGFLSLFLGCVLLSSFLTEYIQIYGAKHFAYPVQGDPLSYAVTRGLILPLPTSVLSSVPLVTPTPIA